MRNTIIFVVLALLAAATWWAGRTPAPTAAPTRTEVYEPLGYYLQGAQLTGTDEQGRVAYQIFAERLEELPEQAGLALRGVRIDYQPADATPWRISAASALTPKDTSRVDLRGNVELASAPTDGSEPLLIATEQLSFWPETSSAEADETVRIRIGDWKLEAKRLRTHLKDDTLRLESDVHGQFSP